MGSEHISTLVSRYEHDEVEQLVLVVEQLERCAQLLKTEEVVSWRMATILLDNMADVLLSRHAESRFRAGEFRGGFLGPHPPRSFTRRERSSIRRDFKQKLELATGSGPYEDVVAVISKDDAAALVTGRGHRNRAYHADGHNAGVLHLVGLLQLEALTRLLPATTSRLAVTCDGNEAWAAPLLRHGVEPRPRSGLRCALCLHESAMQVGEDLTDGLELPLDGVQAWLAGDLLERVEVANGVVIELLESGMEPWRIPFVLEHSEFWDAHGGDEGLVDLERRARWQYRLDERGPDGRWPVEIEDDMAAANEQRNDRYVRLRRKFRPRARLDVLTQIIGEAPRLCDAATLDATLALYSKLDADLRALERYLPEAVRAWDAIVDHAIDAAREA